MINSVAVYADGTQVYGFRMKSGKINYDIGNLKGTPVTQNFDLTSQLIGFYGSTNEAKDINSILYVFTFHPLHRQSQSQNRFKLSKKKSRK